MYAALRFGVPGLSLALGEATSRNSIEKGDWFRYDYKFSNKTAGKYYIFATVSNVTAAYASEDPVIASALGTGARDYTFDIEIITVATNVSVTLNDIKVNDSSSYPYVRLIPEANDPENIKNVGLDLFKTTGNESITSRIVTFNQDIAVSKIPRFYSRYYPGGDPIGYYILNIYGWSLEQPLFEKDTGILLYTAPTDFGIYGRQDAGLFLTASSFKNVGNPDAPDKPLFRLADGPTGFIKTIVITNYDSAAKYHVIVSIYESGNATYTDSFNEDISNSSFDIPYAYSMNVDISAQVSVVKDYIYDYTNINFCGVTYGGNGTGTVCSHIGGTPGGSGASGTKPGTMTITKNETSLSWAPVASVTSYYLYFYTVATNKSRLRVSPDATSIDLLLIIPSGNWSMYMTVFTSTFDMESSPSNIVSMYVNAGNYTNHPTGDKIPLEPKVDADETASASVIGFIIIVLVVVVAFFLVRKKIKPGVAGRSSSSVPMI
jgi:hypothetical protein